MELAIHYEKHGRLTAGKVPDDRERVIIRVKTCSVCRKEAFRKGYSTPFIVMEGTNKDVVKRIPLTERQYFWVRRILGELTTATQLNGKFNSTHEGYAVLLEEVDELWDGIKGNLSQELLAAEAVQVAAMALRFLLDLCAEAFR